MTSHDLRFYWSCLYFFAMEHKCFQVGVSSMRTSKFISFLIRSGLVALCLIATFAFQVHYLSSFDIAERISLFYLPAAVITLSALTMRYGAALGIFIGYAAINLYVHGSDPTSALLLSLVPPAVMIATIAVLSILSKRIDSFFRPHSTLIEVDAFDILLFCAGYGVINASLHHILFYLDTQFATPVSPFTIGQMMFGDLTGSFLGFIALNIGYSLLVRLMRNHGTRSNRP